VRQWQHLFYNDRLSEVAIPQESPDLVKLADAYGIPGFRASSIDELDAVLEKAVAVTDQPVLIDIRVDPEEMVFPMIPAGQPNDAIIESAEEWHDRQAAAAEAVAATVEQLPVDSAEESA